MWSIILGKQFKSISKLQKLAEGLNKRTIVYTSTFVISKNEINSKFLVVKSLEQMFSDKPMQLIVCLDSVVNDTLEALAELYLTQSGISSLKLFLFDVETSLDLPEYLQSVKIEKFNNLAISSELADIALTIAKTPTAYFHRPSFVMSEDTTKEDIEYLRMIAEGYRKKIDILYDRETATKLVLEATDCPFFNLYAYANQYALMKALWLHSVSFYVKVKHQTNVLTSDFYWLLLNHQVVFTDCQIANMPMQFNSFNNAFAYLSSATPTQIVNDRLLLQSIFLHNRKKSVGDVKCM